MPHREETQILRVEQERRIMRSFQEANNAESIVFILDGNSQQIALVCRKIVFFLFEFATTVFLKQMSCPDKMTDFILLLLLLLSYHLI